MYKSMTLISRIFPVLILSFACCGCFDGQVGRPGGGRQTTSLSDVRMIGLTEMAKDADGSRVVDVYVDIDNNGLTDGRISDDTTFRFELYEYVSLAARHAGSRMHIWPDIVVSDPDDEQWKDHLRAYNFRLPINFALPAEEVVFVLQVTVIAGANGMDRDLFILKNQ